MKIFVTGATGFVGAAFCRRAVQQGHEVTGLISPGRTPPADLAKLASMNWIAGRVEALPTAELQKLKLDVCVHSAWISTPGEYLESPLNEQHRRWSEDLVAVMARIGLAHFVGVGTCLEYAPNPRWLQEDSSPTANNTAYARGKNAFRESLFTLARQLKFTACWGRVFYPYGPGEHPARLCTSLLQKFRRGEKLVLKTPNSTKDYIFIDDLAAAMLATVEQRVAGIINWGTGEGVSVRHLADTVAGLLGCPQLVEEVSPPQVDPLGDVVADATRLRNLGWRPGVDLTAGIQRLRDSL